MSFITIQFGDDQKLFFNLLCPTVVLYQNIRQRCTCEPDAVVDIADENGVLKRMQDRPNEQYAVEYLQGRGNYILLKVVRKVDHSTGKEFSTFESLLNNVQDLYPDLMSKVHSTSVNPDVGLKVEAPVPSNQKSTPRSKPGSRGSNKPRSPANRAGSIAGNQLPNSFSKIRSTTKTSSTK